MRPGNHLGDVSAAIQRSVEIEGLSIIRTLVGHGIGREMHEDPQVPNFGEPGQGPVLEEGTVLAIEPMVNAGGPLVRMGDDGWAVYSEGRLAGRPLRVHDRRHRRRPADSHPLARAGLMSFPRTRCSDPRTRRPGPRSTSTSPACCRLTTRSLEAAIAAPRRPACRRSRSRRRRGSCWRCWPGRSAPGPCSSSATLGWLQHDLARPGAARRRAPDHARGRSGLRGGRARQRRARRARRRGRDPRRAALETLPALEAEGAGPFDLVFIDADKVHTPDYFAWSLERTRRAA